MTKKFISLFMAIITVASLMFGVSANAVYAKAAPKQKIEVYMKINPNIPAKNIHHGKFGNVDTFYYTGKKLNDRIVVKEKKTNKNIPAKYYKIKVTKMNDGRKTSIKDVGYYEFCIEFKGKGSEKYTFARNSSKGKVVVQPSKTTLKQPIDFDRAKRKITVKFKKAKGAKYTAIHISYQSGRAITSQTLKRVYGNSAEVVIPKNIDINKPFTIIIEGQKITSDGEYWYGEHISKTYNR